MLVFNFNLTYEAFPTAEMSREHFAQEHPFDAPAVTGAVNRFCVE